MMTGARSSRPRLSAAFVAAFAAGALSAQVPLPPPAGAIPTASFVTVIDVLADCRLIAFDGFTVHVQDALGSVDLVPLGTLPPGYLGATDPAFAVEGPTGKILLGAGFGGSRGGAEPALNGNLFLLPPAGGEATLVASVPYHVQATWLDDHRALLTVGDPTFSAGSVVVVDVSTAAVALVVDGLPGSPGGIALAPSGDLYVGLGFASDIARNGEIRRFMAADLAASLSSGSPLDYELDGVAAAQMLSAAELDFDGQGDLIVGGGDFFGITGSFGFFAVLEPTTGAVLASFDPSDGDPLDPDFVFYEVAACPELGFTAAVDLNGFFFGPTPGVTLVATSVPSSPFTVRAQPGRVQLECRSGSGSAPSRRGQRAALHLWLEHADPRFLDAAGAGDLVAIVAGVEVPMTPAGGSRHSRRYRVAQADLELALCGLARPRLVRVTVRAGVLDLGATTITVR